MTDMTAMVNVLQQQNVILSSILKALNGGIAVLPTPAVFTVATLPASAANGQFAFASNGRKAGEGAGLGTGVPAFFNAASGTWFSYLSGVLVTA